MHGAVDRDAGLAFPGALDVFGQVGERQVEAVLGIQVVAGLGHGERDDARALGSTARQHSRERWLVGQHLANRLDALVNRLARWRHGFQHVAPVLRTQGVQHRGHVGAQVGAGNRPERIAVVDQLLHVDSLMRPVKGTQPEVEHHERSCGVGNWKCHVRLWHTRSGLRLQKERQRRW